MFTLSYLLKPCQDFFRRLPGEIRVSRVGRRIQRQSSEQLRQALRGKQYHIFHIILVVLLVRGEDIQEEVGCILNLLKSEDLSQRRQGWRCLRIAYPELAAGIDDYNPEAPSEDRRTRTDAIAHAA